MPTPFDALAVVGAVAATAMTVGALIRGAWRLNRRIVHIADAVRELSPNGGSTLADRGIRIEDKFDRHLEDHRTGVA